MTRLSIVLLAAVIFSALYLVQVQYQSRRLVTQLERAEAQGRLLDIDHARLQVERRAQARALRVAQLAQDKLSMRPISPAITEYVTVPTAAKAQESAR